MQQSLMKPASAMVAHIVLAGFFSSNGASMSFSQAEVDSVKAALLALATGDRVVSATVGGKRVEYGQADIPQLRELLSAMQSSLPANSSGRTLLVETSKGF